MFLMDEKGDPVSAGTLLTLYWVWDWLLMVMGNPGAPPGILNEAYISCMDI